MFGNDDGKPGVVTTYNLSQTGPPVTLTAPGSNRYAIWSSDSRRLIFQSKRDGEEALYWQATDGSEAERLTTPAKGEFHEPESVSGDTLLFSVTKGAVISLETLSLTSRVRTPYKSMPSSLPTGATFSRNGRLVAYASTWEGRTALFVQSFPFDGTRSVVPARTANETPKYPRWHGDELFYDPFVNTFECVRVMTQSGISFGNPEGTRSSCDLRRRVSARIRHHSHRKVRRDDYTRPESLGPRRAG